MKRQSSDATLSGTPSTKKGRKLKTAENDAKEKAEVLLCLVSYVKEALDTFMEAVNHFKNADDYMQNIPLALICNGITFSWKRLARRAHRYLVY